MDNWAVSFSWLLWIQQPRTWWAGISQWDIESFGCMPRCGRAVSYDRSTYSFLRNLNTDFHKWLHQFELPPTSEWVFLFSHTLSSICYIYLKSWSHYIQWIHSYKASLTSQATTLAWFLGLHDKWVHRVTVLEGPLLTSILTPGEMQTKGEEEAIQGELPLVPRLKHWAQENSWGPALS